MFVWALFFPHAALQAPDATSAEWFAIVIASYIVGHLVQAIANTFAERYPSLRPKARDAWQWLPEKLQTDILEKLHVDDVRRNATDAERETHALRVFELCDIVVQQKGTGGDREIYQYREGFYRGLVVAFLFSLVAVIIRAAHSGGAVVGHHHLTGGEYLLICVFLAVAAILAYHRWLRFFDYKLHNGYGSFAFLTNLIKSQS